MEAASIQAGTPTGRRSRGLSERRLAAYMVSPSLLLIALVAAYPIVYAIWLSLHEYSVRVAGLSRWAGLGGNYSEALQDPEFWDACRTRSSSPPVSVTFEVIIGMGMALAMHSAFRGQGLLRTVVLVPWAVLTVVTAIMWRTIFDPTLGLVNARARARRHRLARRVAPRDDRDDHRRRLEDGAVHGAAAARRAAGDTR